MNITGIEYAFKKKVKVGGQADSAEVNCKADLTKMTQNVRQRSLKQEKAESMTGTEEQHQWAGDSVGHST